MGLSAVELPLINEWPYQGIEASFKEAGLQPPVTLMVGIALWALLRDLSDADYFFVCDSIPIRLDVDSILEPHEFMFTRQWNE